MSNLIGPLGRAHHLKQTVFPLVLLFKLWGLPPLVSSQDNLVALLLIRLPLVVVQDVGLDDTVSLLPTL